MASKSCRKDQSGRDGCVFALLGGKNFRQGVIDLIFKITKADRDYSPPMNLHIHTWLAQHQKAAAEHVAITIKDTFIALVVVITGSTISSLLSAFPLVIPLATANVASHHSEYRIAEP